MSLLLVVSLVLVACQLGRASVLRHSVEETQDAHPSPIIRTNRCLGEPLQSIRKVILDSMNLQTEPRVSIHQMDLIREQWTHALNNTNNFEATRLNMAENSTSSSTGPSTVSQCCKFASQIFTKDLGWDKWIVYPQSFTYIQCRVCDQQGKVHCMEDDPLALDPAFPTPQKLCCEATQQDNVPFLYLDETNSLVIASVFLTRECGCSHGDNPQAPNP
ncbi:gonadal somatic cell derived factor [Trichomycterus rosablanca]|uniref:gonadal somatic cell derived factor n=1 Tax=Trichomycterus rosablanca TaxID=2290929 RepID=UPI002F35D8AC